MNAWKPAFPSQTVNVYWMWLRTIKCDSYGYFLFQQLLSHHWDSNAIADWEGRSANKPVSQDVVHIKENPETPWCSPSHFASPSCDSGSMDFSRGQWLQLTVSDQLKCLGSLGVGLRRRKHLHLQNTYFYLCIKQRGDLLTTSSVKKLLLMNT